MDAKPQFANSERLDGFNGYGNGLSLFLCDRKLGAVGEEFTRYASQLILMPILKRNQHSFELL